MVKPLIGVMISLFSAGVVYLKSHSEISESHDRQVADYAVLKARVISNSESILQFKAEQKGLKVVITLPSNYTIDDQVNISNFTLRGTYWRNGTGYNSNAIIYDS